ncbi:MAG: aliphatic sulfonate ABC transporter substrate-binding protein [Ethanoligenens sp.]
MRHSIIKRAALIMTGALMVIGLSACNSGGTAADSSANSGSPLKELNVALFPNLTHAQGLVGKNNGDFQKAIGSSTTINWKSYNAGPDETQAFLTGAEDIGYIGPGPAITGYVQSHGDIQIVAGSTDGGALLIARKGAGIKSVKDLAGKKVAIPQYGNTQHLLLLNLLQKNGLKTADKGGTVTVQQVNNPDVQTLFDKGALDAALVPEPWGSTLIQKDDAQVVLDQNALWLNGKYATAVVIARKDFIKAHPDVLEKFLKAHVALTDYINKNPQAAQDAINNQINVLTQKKLSTDILATSFKNTTVVNDPSKASVLDFATFAKDAGYLQGSSDYKTLFDFTALNKVLKADGKATIS